MWMSKRVRIHICISEKECLRVRVCERERQRERERERERDQCPLLGASLRCGRWASTCGLFLLFRSFLGKSCVCVCVRARVECESLVATETKDRLTHNGYKSKTSPQVRELDFRAKSPMNIGFHVFGLPQGPPTNLLQRFARKREKKIMQACLNLLRVIMERLLLSWTCPAEPAASI